MPDQSFSLLLKQKRKQQKLTQAAAAECWGVNLRTLQDWESGRARPAGENLERMLKLVSEVKVVEFVPRVPRAYQRLTDEQKARIEAERWESMSAEHRAAEARLRLAKPLTHQQDKARLRREDEEAWRNSKKDAERDLKQREKALAERERKLLAREKALSQLTLQVREQRLRLRLK
ncbi:MAG: helix-turn-helix domain-containing protein [Acidobacteriota bacterium]